jgi:DNA phosphorothioation-dependent restriction protein DptG
MNNITKYIEETVYDYDKRWDSVSERKENLKEFLSIVFKEVFDIVHANTDTNTLYDIMEEIDTLNLKTI